MKAPDDRDSRYAWYVVSLLTTAYAVAFIDRQVLNLLVDPIKRELALGDVEVSLLQGLAFMGAYIAFGPLFARAGVGAAEACLIAAAWSLLSDYFSRERLPQAMSVFVMGPYIGGGLALIFGGVVIGSVDAIGGAIPLLADLSAWRLTFVCVGIPGLLLALALIPFCIALPFAPSYGSALALAAGATFCYSFPQSMAASALQFAAPNRMRGVVSSVYVLLASVMGLGIAPTVVATITEFAFDDPARVGESLAIVATGAGALAAWLMFGSLSHYRQAVEAT
jgi:MFS family permease